MSDFSDRPFVAGSLVGLRAFRIDPLGRLTGVTHRDVWTPSENVAVCHREPYDDGATERRQSERDRAAAAIYNYTPSGYASGGMITSPLQAMRSIYANSGLFEPVRQPKNHTFAAVDCSCGFYAYFDGNDYLDGDMIDDSDPAVGAIIEGWGTCTVGTRGFRASKAKVLALIDPDGDTARTLIAFEKVRRAYPDLRVFANEREAIQAFPLSEPFAASPADDDFWTRSAR